MSGRTDKEPPTIAELRAYITEQGLAVAGQHHEIYISDPRKTPPAKLKTVIRLSVKAAAPKAPVRKTPTLTAAWPARVTRVDSRPVGLMLRP